MLDGVVRAFQHEVSAVDGGPGKFLGRSFVGVGARRGDRGLDRPCGVGRDRDRFRREGHLRVQSGKVAGELVGSGGADGADVGGECVGDLFV